MRVSPMIDFTNIRNHTVDYPKEGSVFGNAEDFAALPETHQEQILFLDNSASDYLFRFTGPSANLVTGGGWNPFAKGNFRTVEECMDLSGTEESNSALKKWLFRRSIPFKTWVFVLLEDYDTAMLVTWKMVVKYAPSIFFGNDGLVFDTTLNWCLYHFHENRLFFWKRQPVRSCRNRRHDGGAERNKRNDLLSSGILICNVEELE